ncbi:hypothetical protein ACOMHN_063062 [Nucella lapillus]
MFWAARLFENRPWTLKNICGFLTWLPFSPIVRLILAVFTASSITCAVSDSQPTSQHYSSSRPVLDCSYTKAQLLFLNKLAPLSLSPSVSEKLKAFGLVAAVPPIPGASSHCQHAKKTRPYRAGRRKQRPLRRRAIPVQVGFPPVDNPHDYCTPGQTGVNKTNLVPIDRQPSVQEVSKQFKVLYFNAQSCRNKTIELYDFIRESNANLVFITETWFMAAGDEVKMCEITPPGFVLHSCPRALRGGGVAVLYKESLKPCTTFPKTADGLTTFELCKVHLIYAGQGMSFLCLYRPPPSKGNKLNTSRFMEEFPQLLDSCGLCNSKTIILGDFNFHYDSTTDCHTKILKDLLTTHSMRQLIDKPTHKSHHIIDWLIVEEENSDSILDLSVSDQLVSDHFPISFSLNIKKPGPRKRSVTSRNLRAVDMVAFRNDVAALQFSEEDPVTDYNQGLTAVLDSHAPLMTRCVTDRPSAPWLTLEVKQSKQQRRQAERQWRKTHLVAHRQMFQQCRDDTKDLISDVRTAHTSARVE